MCIRDRLVRFITFLHTKLIKFNQTKVGKILIGDNILLLETIGRKSNKIRKTPLTYVQIDDGYLVAASYGGRDKTPDWFYNIDNQNVRVFVNKEYQNVKPSVVKTDKEKYWSLLTAVYPTFNLYRSKTDRDIPLVKLITEQV